MAQVELGDQETSLSTGTEEHERQNDYEVCWEEDDPANPHAMASKRKWVIVSLVCTMTVCVCVTSSLYTTTYNQIMAEFHCSRTVATLGLSFYIAGLGWGPLVMSPLSEFYGRRPIYLVSLPLYVVFLIPCAAAHNIQTMLVARFLDGLAGAAFTSVAGATVGDMYIKSTLHTPMLLYTASPFTGASIGPILGGLINTWALCLPSVHWIVPIIGSAVFGAGMIFVFQGVFTFFVDAYPLYAASALGANSFTRSTFAAAFPLFGVAMYHKLGDQWATSLLAFLSLSMAPFPYIFFRYGKRIRSRSRFAA
ncbi:hypothetical protein CBS147482_7959 [Aspergillus niger]|nr:hypothetical protein CBS133816_4301 [Aspergillus niger]KAI2996743.1 hypothetical protein CBS147482_7959 [Aspergillus niger]KAI3012317.1 hypothetical protein CBS147346_694 [Aspergillus niger]KAI3013642.1 hypothetical protein CBS147345_5726 [Aspergillus niger]KAI3049417.1 hypothetical protein CBS147352_5953 [Aspergillus niger]